MIHLRRHLAALLAVLALGGAGVASATAQESGGDNAAVAVNTRDDSSLFRLAFSIRQVMGETVDQTNAAVAYSSCERCQTVAIAIQVLIVVGDVDVFTPQNVAVAVNENCTLCETLATAYQFVVGSRLPLRLTSDGRKAIAEIRKELRELRRSGLSVEEIQRRVDALAGRLREVLRTELVAREDDEDDEDDERDESDESDDDGSTETAPDDGSVPPDQTAPEDGGSPPTGTSPEPTETAPGTETTPAAP